MQKNSFNTSKVFLTEGFIVAELDWTTLQAFPERTCKLFSLNSKARVLNTEAQKQRLLKPLIKLAIYGPSRCEFLLQIQFYFHLTYNMTLFSHQIFY